MAQCDACARRVRSDAQTCPYCSAALTRAYYLPAWSDPDTRRWIVAGGGAMLSCAALCVWMLLPRPVASASTTPVGEGEVTTIAEVTAPASLLPGQTAPASTTTPTTGSTASPKAFVYGSGAMVDWASPIEAWIERYRQWDKARRAWRGENPEGRNKRLVAKKGKLAKVARNPKKGPKKPAVLAKKPKSGKRPAKKVAARTPGAPALVPAAPAPSAALRGR